MLTLFQWNFMLRFGVPVGVGIVSGHPRLPDGTDIHTSQIRRLVKTEDGLLMETVSGSRYYLQMEEWSPSAREAGLLDPKALGLPPDFWMCCAQVRKEACRKKTAELSMAYKPGTLFLRVVGTHILSAFWIDAGAQGQGVPVLQRQGMFQDSYIITDAYQNRIEPRQVDLRYFQDSYIITDAYQNRSGPHRVDLRLFLRWNHLEPYKISQSLETLMIRNEGCTNITFGPFDRKISCGAGAITSIPVRNLLEQ